MAFFAQTGPTARGRLSEKLGTAIGEGIGENIAQGRQKKQQSDLASQLFGDQADQYKDLPVDAQLKTAALQKKMTGEHQAELLKQNQYNAKKRLLKQLGLPEENADLPDASFNSYIKSKAPSKKLQSDQPIEEDQMERILKVRNMPGFDDMTEVDQYRAFTNEGVSRKNALDEAELGGKQKERQSKAEEKAYNDQKPFIDEITNKYRSFETDMKPKMLQMQAIPDEEVISPIASVFLEGMGIPLGALDDPSSELYKKLSLDLLKGLPEAYGSKILKVEVENFLKTIPSLVNSVDGRRMIASNFLKLGEMKQVYYEEMRRQQKDANNLGKPLPRDFQQNIFDQVKPQIDRINREFTQLSTIKSVPKGKVPFFSPSGEVIFVPPDKMQWVQENGARRIW